MFFFFKVITVECRSQKISWDQSQKFQISLRKSTKGSHKNYPLKACDQLVKEPQLSTTAKGYTIS